MSSSLKKRYLAKLLSSAINGLLTLAITAIVPRALGPASYGAFTFLTTFFSNIIGFFDVGSSIAFYTKLSKRQNEKTIIGFYILFVMFLFLLSVLLLCISMLPDFRESIYGQNGAIFIIAGFGFAFLTWVSQIAIKISDAYGMTVDIELIKTLHRLFFFIVIATMAYLNILSLGGFFIYHFALIGSFILILGFYFYKKDILSYKIFYFGFSDLKNYIREFYSYSHPLLVGTILSTASSLAVLWLLQQFYGNRQIGFYGLSYQIASACFVFTAALTPIITREFAVSYQAGDIDKMRALFARYIPMLYSIAAFFSAFLAVHSDTVTQIIGGDLYGESATVVAVMALYPIHQTYGQLSGSVFYATENTRLSRNISIVSSFIFLVLGTVFLLPEKYFGFGFGALGFAGAMVFTQIISVNLQLWFNMKFLNLSMRYFVFHQLYALLFFYVLAKVSTFIVLSSTAVANFAISGFIYACLVIIGIYCFPQIFAISKQEIGNSFSKIKVFR